MVVACSRLDEGTLRPAELRSRQVRSERMAPSLLSEQLQLRFWAGSTVLGSRIFDNIHVKHIMRSVGIRTDERSPFAVIVQDRESVFKGQLFRELGSRA